MRIPPLGIPVHHVSLGFALTVDHQRYTSSSCLTLLLLVVVLDFISELAVDKLGISAWLVIRPMEGRSVVLESYIQWWTRPVFSPARAQLTPGCCWSSSALLIATPFSDGRVGLKSCVWYLVSTLVKDQVGVLSSLISNKMHKFITIQGKGSEL